MKTCDICGEKIGLFNTFRCQDGAICKKCYKIVSGNFATTIAKMTMPEVKKLYIRNAQPLEMGDGGFQTTRKISSFLLLDENNRKLCILNKQKNAGGSTRPEVIPYDALRHVRLCAEPNFSYDQLTALVAEKNDSVVIEKLSVRLILKNQATRDIVVIPTPVRASTFAFRQGYKVAEEIFIALTDL